MAKKLIRDYVFTPGVAGAGLIRIPGRYAMDQVLVVTNGTRNITNYSFADSTYTGTTAVFTAGNLASVFPTITQREDGYTTITFAVSTATQNAADDLLIYVEGAANEDATSFRPWNFGTDAIERMRVSNPESLIDADFEYGLQPTKWAGFGTVKGYPSIYELPGIDLEVLNVNTDFTTTSTNNSLISVTFTGPHGMANGQAINVSGLLPSVPGFSKADGSYLIFNVGANVVQYFARGQVGTSNGQSLFTSDTLIKRGGIYTNASIPVASATSSGANPSVITLTFANPHGLLPGTTIHAIVGSGTNAVLATGPFVVLSTPALNTLTYVARPGAAVTSPASVTLYAISNATLIHRYQDGGVILETKSPTYGASVIRQSKKYFRYQSGKGFLWSSGTLFKPNYDIREVSASGTGIGATITVRTDEIDHGLQVGAYVTLSGILTSGYNNTYIVNSVTDDYTFTVLAKTSLGSATPILDISSSVAVNAWTGSSVRSGMFDDQNGVFWEYDGRTLFAVKRSATLQITGTVSANQNSNQIVGANTRFLTQVRNNDKVVVRGMTHMVTQVANNSHMFVTPDYRGVTGGGIKASLVREVRVPQSQFNLDKMDGTGPSGFNVDLNKMQMIGLQFSWYGAGFIDFMMRGPNGNWLFAHRMKNNNINNEAYMRSGNLPVRYSIENDNPYTFLTANVTSSDTTIPVADLTYFPSNGTIYIDNELINFTGRSTTAGAGNLTGATRAATMTQFVSGNNYVLSCGTANAHYSGTGVIIVNNTCSPTLSHWGSALVMDGGFDEDRGYIFNFQRVSMNLTTTNQTAFMIRLAPSVKNSQVGELGAKDLLNRSQLLLNAIGIAISGGNNVGAVLVEGVLNPKNFNTAGWRALNVESLGGQPSFSQVANTFTFTAGSFALPGEQVFAFSGPSANGAGSVNDRLDLTALKELTGAPLGGDRTYPDGSDILAVNVRLTSGTAQGHVLLRWSEAQA
jgi:hypothetical protein